MGGNHRSAFSRARVGLLAPVLLLTGCYLQSPYVTREDVASPGASSSSECNKVINCNSGDADVGSRNAVCTEHEFEKAVTGHAAFATALGESLIPLAGLVAYKGVFGKNQHHVAALATGGAAGYALGNYLYKPTEEIYLTGVSAIECAQRMTDARKIAPTDAAFLQGVVDAGRYSSDSQFRADFDRGVALRKEAEIPGELMDRVGNAAEALKQEAADRSCRTESKASSGAIAAAVSHVDDQRRTIGDIEQRLENAQAAARNLIRESSRAERDLCRAADQIRTDINHMLTRQQADPSTLAGTLSALKNPAPAAGASGTGTSKNSTPAPTTDQISGNLMLGAPLGGCDLSDKLASLQIEESRLDAAVADADHAVEGIQRTLTDAAPADSQVDVLLRKCGVGAVEKPALLSLSVTGTIEIAQGTSYQVAISGGRSPYKWILPNEKPVTGSIDVTKVGSDAVGNAIKIAVAEKTTTGPYGVVVIDADGSTQSFTVKVK